MKKWISILLIFTFSFLLLSCHRSTPKDPLKFFYIRKEIDFESDAPVITSELRESNGNSSDINALLQLYINGPESDFLYSPIPEGTQLIRTEQTDDILFLCLSDSFAGITGLDLSLACIALGKTAMELTDAQQVRICAETEMLDGEEWIIISEENILLTEPSLFVTDENK